VGAVEDYIKHHYRHFNAAALVDAAEGWKAHLDAGGEMLLTLGGAMSTAELGILIAELIREKKVHALSVTGANLEEDLFNLVAHESYARVPHSRSLTAEQEEALHARGMNRVTDTCIPEDVAMRRIEAQMLRLWTQAERDGERAFPHEFFYRLIRNGDVAEHYAIDPRDSWLVAAAEADLPLFVPGWEDSTLGNMYAAAIVRGDVQQQGTVKSGIEQMVSLIDWYRRRQAEASVGFFQVGGGISGDFPICVVPLLNQDLQENVRVWGYFCQISEATTSYGSYSGAVPNEKITWGKLSPETPKFVIESDATIVFPLVAGYVLGR